MLPPDTQEASVSENRQLIPGPRYYKGMHTEARLVLSDVDNTLVPNESLGLPTARVTQVFREAGEKVPTGLATARQPQKFAYLARHLKLTGKSILSNGAQIFDGKEGLMVVERLLQIQTTMEIARALQANGVDHWIQDGGVDHRRVRPTDRARGHVGREVATVPELGSETPLFGREGVLDSLGLVALVVAVEQAIEDEYGVSVSLADERALSEGKSPFRTVGALADYAGRLIDGAR